MSGRIDRWKEWIASLNSVDHAGKGSLHQFLISARMGLWPALMLSSFAFGHLLGYETGGTILIGIDLCLAASIAFLFNDIQDADIDAANKICRWSIKSRFDVSLFATAFSLTVLVIAVSAIGLNTNAIIGISSAMVLGLVYSLVLKRVVLVGNLFAALLSLSPGLIMFVDSGSLSTADAHRPAAAVFLFCASLFLISREIKFDEFDIVGDRIGGRTTLPMTLSPSGLRALHAVLLLTSVVSLFAVIATMSRFSPALNCVLALLTSTLALLLIANAYFSKSKEKFYKSTRILLLIIPVSMCVGF